MNMGIKLITTAMAAAAALTALNGPAIGATAPSSATGPSSASDPSASTSADARLADGSRVNSQAAAGKVTRYWTKDRMRRAVDVSQSTDSSSPALRAAAPHGKPAATPAADPTAQAVKAAARKLAGGDARLAIQIAESATVGKVFYTKPSTGLPGYKCSASALNTPSLQLVITAGHCVHEGAGGTWMRNWTFVPRYRNGAAPFGTFAAKQFRSFDAWMNSSDNRRDVGLVTTWPLNGQKLVNVVGGMGLSWNWPQAVPVTTFGYPSNFNSGEIQQWCQGTTRAVSDGRIEIACNNGPGASGGPWLRNFDANTGRGSVNGVFSTITTSGWNRSPYFDDAVKAMVDAQGSVT
ncbi:trypsin-like serine peptidase [Spirillospora sp. NPDC048911]|uniref:trypsin-like serine peptidase n=1 Tax=Spirillospora sp. NPDC048911 TaxID=3364527 RepID=UPI00371B9172